ncbi:NAM8 (YHR086W) [Zygosaccharomyces parabailii]|uniref:BN860_03422g1_1 n=1 Tax=Zygosaccharomyces bailii (strain CLIB 213 / ATCC 58445 / CBS 680 / BCRC 21525 / NBRC 1098 / NCYC 1416 / NRRL Y-2227) TaxID=1333698 RepID=A0A8J2T1T9_ZYGB2|nr:NAM8 (YHR086W) [Zygosaccharomyces parabailii]CDF87306.1 BN860_03422g1_1 [Zygosaccharomyces bailii CLIB 213]CDH15627.1 related to Protein NAM8 [Zygosaccharomyces bailii ISA1307]
MSFNMNGSPNHYPKTGAMGSSRSFKFNSSSNGSNSPVNHSVTSVGRGSQLYMGDLDPSWDENTIRHIWASLGEQNVVIKLMWQNNANGNGTMGPRNNLGYCFVEFPSAAHASNALLKNGVQIPDFGSKRLKLNWASSSHSSAGATNEYSVFVGDLAPNVTESQLFELFIGRFNSTSHVKVVYDQVTGVSKGYAFVKFTNPAHQQRALLEMQGIFLNGRAIRVSNAGHQQSAADSKAKSTAVATNNANVMGTSQFMYPVQPQPTLNSFTDPNNTTVFVGGLSSLVTEDELRAYFQPFGTIVYVKIPVGKGCGFVQYVDRISAETAIAKMQGFPIGNSRIRLSWGRSAKQAATVQQAMINNALQQQQQQQQWQQLQQQQQPMLQQPTYGYVPTSTSTASTPLSSLYNDMSYLANGNSISPLQNSAPLPSSAKMLLPGYQSVDYFGFPPSASGFLSTANYDYMATPAQQHASPFQNQASGAVPLNNGFNQPQVAVQNNDRGFIDNKTASLDRLENGSNGFVFA